MTAAIARTAIAGIPDAEAVLADAIERGEVEARNFENEAPPDPMIGRGDIFRDAVNLYAGGMTYVDLEPDEDLRKMLEVEINLASLMAWIADMKGEVSPDGGEKRGRKGKLPWDEVYLAFVDKCQRDGFPDDLNVNGWSIQADVERWITELAEREDPEGVSTGTARTHAREFMARYRAEN